MYKTSACHRITSDQLYIWIFPFWQGHEPIRNIPCWNQMNCELILKLRNLILSKFMLLPSFSFTFVKQEWKQYLQQIIARAHLNTMYKAQYLEQFLVHNQYYYYKDAGMPELSKLKDEKDTSSWMQCTWIWENIIYTLKPIFYWVENNHLPKYVRQHGEIRNVFMRQTSSIGEPMQKHLGSTGVGILLLNNLITLSKEQITSSAWQIKKLFKKKEWYILLFTFYGTYCWGGKNKTKQFSIDLS